MARPIRTLVAIRKDFASRGVDLSTFDERLDSVIGGREDLQFSAAEFKLIKNDAKIDNGQIVKYVRLKRKVRQPGQPKIKPERLGSGQIVKNWETPGAVRSVPVEIEKVGTYDVLNYIDTETSVKSYQKLEQVNREDPKSKYQDYLKSDHWKTMQRLALEYAERRCQVCFSTKALNVHHRTYARVGHEKLTDLTVLCSGCHSLFHQNAKLCRN